MANSSKIWFRRKIYGWGWCPCTWQGWLFLLAWVGLFVRLFILTDKASHSISDFLIGMIVPVAMLFIILFLVCYGKGEKPRWSWGRDRILNHKV